MTVFRGFSLFAGVTFARGVTGRAQRVGWQPRVVGGREGWPVAQPSAAPTWPVVDSLVQPLHGQAGELEVQEVGAAGLGLHDVVRQ